MRKTFLKVALIGLLVGSLPVGFTSCKDYDDDIENTNNKVADLQTKLSSVETAIAALPSKADVTAAQAAAVAQAKADLEAVKAQLQAAIDGKAGAEDVAAINGELSKIQGQLETLDALKADVATALEAVANITELNAELQKQGQAIAGLTAQMETLTGSLATEAAGIKADIEANKTSIEAIKAQLTELANKINGEGGDATPIEASLKVINGMITSLRLVNDWGAMKNGGDLQLYNPVTVLETPVGPKGEALLFDMKKGDQKDFTDSVLVQVSPSGATLTQEQLSLVNSQLKGIEDYVVISKVRAYNEKNDILSRAASSNGLYVVYFTQNPEYDFEADAAQAKENKTQTNFAKATKLDEGKGKQIRFAIALEENNEGLGERDVMTPWDLTITGDDVDNTWYLDYNVDKTNVDNIHNRFLYAADGSSFMYQESAVSNPLKNMTGVYAKAGAIASFEAAVEQGYAPVGDYAWNWNGASWEIIYDGNTGTDEEVYGDNRTAKPFYHVEMGKDFVVSLNGITSTTPLYGYYVAIDTYRATESGESEIAAWTKYAENIAGINKVYRSGDITLNIAEAANVPAGDVIGFRVWAVNYDGTLVDPDGRAFYVQVGDAAKVTTSAISATIPVSVNEDLTPYIPVATVASYDNVLGWTTAYKEVTVSFYMNNSEKANLTAAETSTVTVTLGDGTKLTAAMDGEVVTAAKPIPAANYAKMFQNIKVTISDAKFVDGQSYTGYLTITGKNGLNDQTVQIIPVTVKKTVPTTLPASFAVAAGLSSAEADVNVYVNSGDVENGVNVPFNNIFRIFNKPLASGTQWKRFAFLIKLADATQATWSKPGDPAYYTNWIYNGGTNPVLTFVGEPEQDNDGSVVYTLNKTWTNLDNGLVTSVAGKKIPTLDVVNGDVQTLAIFYQYDNLSWKSSDGKTAPAALGNVIVRGDKTLRVQTYANTYTLNAPAMPNLVFDTPAYLAYDALTLTSSAISKVNNSTLTAVEGMDKNLKIENVKFALTGDAAQYFDTDVETITVNVDSKTGKVTTTVNGVNIAVNGVAVKNFGTAAAPNYGLDTPGATTATYTDNIKVVEFTPNAAMANNAPVGNLTGALTLTYNDGFGLGRGFGYVDNVMSVLPYSKPYSVTMKP